MSIERRRTLMSLVGFVGSAALVGDIKPQTRASSLQLRHRCGGALVGASHAGSLGSLKTGE
jgi:hypothetical protein